MTQTKLKLADQKRLDILDLPRDKFQFTGTLRTILVKLTNFVRKNPRHAEYLIAVLSATLEHVKTNHAIATDNKKVIEAATEAPEKPNKTVKEKLTLLRTEAEKAPDITALAALADKIKLTLETEDLDVARKATLAKYDEVIAKQV